MRALRFCVGAVLSLAGCTVIARPAAPTLWSPAMTATVLPTATQTPEPRREVTPTPHLPTATTRPTPELLTATTTATPQPTAASTVTTITVLYDNVAYEPRLQTDWGFACLVEGPGLTLLFDTGGKGDLLLRNMRALSIDPQTVDAVFLSHAHGDHTGGLAAFLAANPRVTVYLAASFPAAIKATVRGAGAALVEVTGPLEIGIWAHSTGELGAQIREQALVLETPRGLVVITGCAHPGVVELTRRAHETMEGAVYLALGGFHLRDANATQIAATITGLQALGVQRVAPSHCTGAAARRALAEAFGPACLESGVGRVLVIASGD